LRVESNYSRVKLPESWDDSNNDNIILKICKGLLEKGENVFLVTKDIFERIKANILDIEAQDFFAEQVPVFEEQYKGRIEVYTTEEKLNEFYSKGFLDEEDVFLFNPDSTRKKPALIVNQFLLIQSYINKKHTALGRF